MKDCSQFVEVVKLPACTTATAHTLAFEFDLVMDFINMVYNFCMIFHVKISVAFVHESVCTQPIFSDMCFHFLPPELLVLLMVPIVTSSKQYSLIVAYLVLVAAA